MLLKQRRKGFESWRAEVTWADLDVAGDEDLKRIYRSQPGLNGPLGAFELRVELQRRQFDRMTRVLVRLTRVITILTAINVVAFVVK